MIQSDKYQTAANLSSGTKMPRSDWKIVSETVFNIPNNTDEQEKVGSFFKKLDTTIALHQRKLTLLKQLKQTSLHLIIPQNEENSPTLRFDGFTMKWDQRKLGDVTTKIGSGKTPKGGNSVYTQSGVPLLRSQNIYNDRVNFEDTVYITESTDNEMANSRVEKNDVLLNITGASIGRTAVYEMSSHSNVNQHVCIIRPIYEIDSYFIQLNLTSLNGQKQIELNQAGGGREGLNFQQIGKIVFSYPSSGEQKKIGDFFKRLDKTTSLHQSKLEKLLELKNVLLGKMFR